MKELYRVGLADYATIEKTETDMFNGYEVNMKICFNDYESAKVFIEQSGFSTAFKKIIDQ